MNFLIDSDKSLISLSSNRFMQNWKLLLINWRQTRSVDLTHLRRQMVRRFSAQKKPNVLEKIEDEPENYFFQFFFFYFFLLSVNSTPSSPQQPAIKAMANSTATISNNSYPNTTITNGSANANSRKYFWIISLNK